MDVLGLSYAEYSDAEREAVEHAHPRTAHFKEDIIQAFYDGIKHKPETTFGNVKADVLADKDPGQGTGACCGKARSDDHRTVAEDHRARVQGGAVGRRPIFVASAIDVQKNPACRRAGTPGCQGRPRRLARDAKKA
jgi:hypothetical protein